MKQWRLFLGSQRKLRFSSCCLTCFLRGLQINHGMQSVLPLPGRNLVTPYLYLILRSWGQFVTSQIRNNLRKGSLLDEISPNWDTPAGEEGPNPSFSTLPLPNSTPSRPPGRGNLAIRLWGK